MVPNPDVTAFDETDVRESTELGMIVKSGGWSFSGAGYAEFSEEHNVIGARIGATYSFPVK